MNVIAIDWSGASDGASRMWLAEVDIATNAVVRLESGRTRAGLANHLIVEARRNPDVVVGIDFAFGLPAWFARTRGFAAAPDLWDLVAEEGERWLKDCQPPFWGHPGKKRPEMKEHFRRTDLEVPSVGGIRPKSVFQIGGVGAVGTGSLRGMPFLRQLRDNGFNIWPFDAPSRPMVVEIYPRTLTGAVNKGRAEERRAFLNEFCPEVESRFLDAAASSEDAFDALVSALVMAENAADFATLESARDDVDRLEGRIWLPSRPVMRKRSAGAEQRFSPHEIGDADSIAARNTTAVPTISAFYGIAIRMHPGDHAPPHFHARYGEHKAVVGIESGVIIRGTLPATARRLVLEWAAIHRDALLENWTLCVTQQQPKKIPPLS